MAMPMGANFNSLRTSPPTEPRLSEPNHSFRRALSFAHEEVRIHRGQQERHHPFPIGTPSRAVPVDMLPVVNFELDALSADPL